MASATTAPAARRLTLVLGATVTWASAPLAALPVRESDPDPAAAAGEGTSRPTSAQRVVAFFDFDEPDPPDPVPLNWFRAQEGPDRVRPGFPPHNRAELDRGVASSGDTSVRLPTRGGSTSLRLHPGWVPVFPQADYAVVAMVRTEGLRHARAFVVARLLDQRSRPIAGSEARSEPLLPGGAWQAVTVPVAGTHPDAAWMQIDLEVLQPRQFEPEPPPGIAKHRVWREDVSGAAWFDDVGVFQVPRTRLSTTSPQNIVVAPQRPVLEMSVRDMGGSGLRARVTLTDLSGAVAAQREFPIETGDRPISWTPELAAYGWYEATMDVVAASSTVSRSRMSFVWLPEQRTSGLALDAGSAAASADRARFGVLAESMPEGHLADLPEIMDRMGVHWVSIPAWRPDATARDAVAALERRGPAIREMLRRNQEITLVLPGVPAELAGAGAADATDALDLASHPESAWAAYLNPTLDIYGQRILRYQIGPTGDDRAFWRADLGGTLTKFEAAIGRLVPGPIITVPWRADRAPPVVFRPESARGETPGAAGVVPPSVPAPVRPSAGAPTAEMLRALGAPTRFPSHLGPLIDAETLLYPATLPPGALRDAAAVHAASGPDAPELTVALQPADASRFGRSAAAADLLRRVVEFWAAFNDRSSSGDLTSRTARLAVPAPWRFTDELRPQASPDPALAVLRNAVDRLAGRRVLGELRATPGVRCLVLARPVGVAGSLEDAALIAWNESAPPGEARVEALATAGRVRVVDLFGNASVLTGAPARASDGGSTGRGTSHATVEVPVSGTPVFIEGIDPYLALFAASFALEPAFVPAVVTEHEHAILLTNPWPIRITGQLQIKQDEEGPIGEPWRVTPGGLIDLDIAPGATVRIPIGLSFGAAQLAGHKEFTIVAKVLADRQYPPVRLKAAVELGLPDLDLSPELQLTPTPAGPDAVVIAAVTNKGDRHRTLRLETGARGYPSQQLQISDLPPGQTVLKRFVFKNGATALSGRRIMISLSDAEEAERLNKAVLVP